MQVFNIVYCCNNFNTSSLCDSIDSILKNSNTKNKINFHILGLNFTQDNKDRVQKVVDSYNNKSDMFVDNVIEMNLLQTLGGGRTNLSQFEVQFYKPQLYGANQEKLTFYRKNFYALANGMPSLYQLFLQDIFSHLDSCLFLDYDVRAQNCISSIFSLDIDKHLAIVSKYKGKNTILSHDSILLYIKDDKSISDFCKYFSLNKDCYFDIGMMLLNLRKMREIQMTKHLYSHALYYSRLEQSEFVNSTENILNLTLSRIVKVVPF